jgi:hypothetical protein
MAVLCVLSCWCPPGVLKGSMRSCSFESSCSTGGGSTSGLQHSTQHSMARMSPDQADKAWPKNVSQQVDRHKPLLHRAPPTPITYLFIYLFIYLFDAHIRFFAVRTHALIPNFGLPQLWMVPALAG